MFCRTIKAEYLCFHYCHLVDDRLSLKKRNDGNRLFCSWFENIEVVFNAILLWLYNLKYH